MVRVVIPLGRPAREPWIARFLLSFPLPFSPRWRQERNFDHGERWSDIALFESDAVEGIVIKERLQAPMGTVSGRLRSAGAQPRKSAPLGSWAARSLIWRAPHSVLGLCQTPGQSAPGKFDGRRPIGTIKAPSKVIDSTSVPRPMGMESHICYSVQAQISESCPDGSLCTGTREANRK